MATAASLLRLFGFDFGRLWTSLSALPRFLADYRELKRQLAAKAGEYPVARFYPVLHEASEQSGVATGQYFHQDLYVARRVHELSPRRHVDVASRIDGFVAHVAVFREIEVADIRSLSTTAKNIRFRQADLMDARSVSKLGVADSVSCLHALEHFGLGRYGDAVNVDGHIEGLRNLCAMVEPGGRLYVSVPIGPQRIEFNGHRVFATTTIPALMDAQFTLERFTYIADDGDIRENVAFDPAMAKQNFGCTFGCGIYEFLRKKQA
jgi:hypothetical protein